jgi:hypothetical protein
MPTIATLTCATFIKSNGAFFSVRELAEIASHEASHTFGNGHNLFGVANADRAPIMFEDGPRFNDLQLATRGTWSNLGGEGDNYYSDQYHVDEMAVIASDDNGFGYRPDDHGDSPATSSTLVRDSTMIGRLTGRPESSERQTTSMFSGSRRAAAPSTFKSPRPRSSPTWIRP